MTSWYIDRTLNINSMLESGVVKNLIKYADELISMSKVPSSFIVKKLEIKGKNPNAFLTGLRDLGLLTSDNKPSAFLLCCVKADVSPKTMAFLMMLKRDSLKSSNNSVKPFVVISKFLVLQYSINKEKKLHLSDCSNYLINVEHYEELTTEFVKSVIDNRDYGCCDDKGVLDIWFNALIFTDMFVGDKKELTLNEDCFDLISFIAEYGVSMKPSSNKNEYIKNVSSSSHGIVDVVSQNPAEAILALNCRKDIFDYLKASGEIKNNFVISIELSSVAKTCAKQIIDFLYDFDKFESMQESIKINDANVKIDPSAVNEKYKSNLYYVFCRQCGKNYDNDERTYLDRDYVILIDGDEQTVRLTNQWMGANVDLNKNRRGNMLAVLIDVVNYYYSGKIEISNENDALIIKKIIKEEELISEDTNGFIELKFNTNQKSEFPYNNIIFGAPGTGKSFKLNRQRKKLLFGDKNFDESKPYDKSQYGSFERVTFHPDYTYANFVGTYKPVPEKDANDNQIITYKFVSGPFMRVYVNALKDARDNGENAKPHILIIEEINRANAAAVFGDVFQLLDRTNGVSDYAIQPSEDIKTFLASEKGLNSGDADDYTELKIPDNMYIWATMNSADQGVFPMDTAFKRRWSFSYLGIDDGASKIENISVDLGSGTIKWNDLRTKINKRLTALNINEDKLIGPFFLSKESFETNDKFINAFKDKVIMYLFEDAAKSKRKDLFVKSNGRYSEICKDFDSIGINIFNNLEND